MELVESSNLVIVLDENEPQDYADTSRLAVSGDYHSKWGDRSSTLIAYKNGRFACVGEVRTIFFFVNLTIIYYEMIIIISILVMMVQLVSVI